MFSRLKLVGIGKRTNTTHPRFRRSQVRPRDQFRCSHHFRGRIFGIGVAEVSYFYLLHLRFGVILLRSLSIAHSVYVSDILPITAFADTIVSHHTFSKPRQSPLVILSQLPSPCTTTRNVTFHPLRPSQPPLTPPQHLFQSPSLLLPASPISQLPPAQSHPKIPKPDPSRPETASLLL